MTPRVGWSGRAPQPPVPTSYASVRRTIERVAPNPTVSTARRYPSGSGRTGRPPEARAGSAGVPDTPLEPTPLAGPCSVARSA